MDILGSNAIFTTTQERDSPYEHDKIDEAFLKKHIEDFSKHFYICGPDKMISDISSILEKLGAKADAVVFEK